MNAGPHPRETSADEALAVLTGHYQQPDRSARRWKASGGRVAGYFCDAVPRELIRAAGLFPYRVAGDGSGQRGQAAKLVDPFMIQPVVTPGFVWSSVEQLLDGRLGFLDYLVIPNGRKPVYAIFRYLETIRRAGLADALPELHYLDKGYTSTTESADFDRRCFTRLADQLERWSGSPVSHDSLARTVALANQQRTMLAELARARCAASPRISGSEALAVIGSSQFMDYGEHIGQLRALLAGLDHRPPRPAAPRVFLGGSPVDRLRLYELIERAGGNVVAEDHCWGTRLAEATADESGDPAGTLADRYACAALCSMRFPVAQTTAACVRRAAAAEPNGAIFWVQSGDAARAWEAPDEARELRERGIDCLLLGDQDYALTDEDAVSGAIARFLGQLAAAGEAVQS